MSWRYSTELTPIKKKTERREKIREKKAEISANIETAIEQELLDRLKEGTYGEIYNYNPKIFEKIMEDQEVDEGEEEVRKIYKNIFQHF